MRVEQTDENRRWIQGLRDRAGKARILVRVDRLARALGGQASGTGRLGTRRAGEAEPLARADPQRQGS